MRNIVEQAAVRDVQEACAFECKFLIISSFSFKILFNQFDLDATVIG